MRILHVILFVLLSFSSIAQKHFVDHRVQRQLELRKVWGYGSVINNSDVNQLKRYGAKGIHFIGLWKDLEPTKDGYDLTAFANNIKRFVDSGLYVTFQLGAGDDAPISGSTHWLVDEGVDTFYTKSGATILGPWPDSYSSIYKNRLLKFYDTVYKKLKSTLSASQLKYIVGHYGVFGSTGDPAPYKGDCISPTNCLDIVDGLPWYDFDFEMLDSIKAVGLRNSMLLVASINTANNHELLERYVASHPFGLDKCGDLSHDMIFTGEKLLYEIPQTNKRGEVQGYPLITDYPHQDVWQTFVVAAAGGLDYLNLPGGYFNNVLQAGESEPDKRITDIFNTYAPHNNVRTARKAFIQLADKIDYADSSRFGTGSGEFGPMIDPTRYNSYNSQKNAINASTYGISHKKFLQLSIIESYLNPARKSAIDAWGSTYGATSSGAGTGDQHFIDCGVGLMKNHSLHITQIDPDNTSEGAYRVGGDTSIYGRFARKFNAAGDPMTFDIDNKWAGGISEGTLKYTITYLNNNTGSWALYAKNGEIMTEVLAVTNTNSGKWEKKTVTVSNHLLGNAEDFALNYISGTKTTFSIIEIDLQ